MRLLGFDITRATDLVPRQKDYSPPTPTGPGSWWSGWGIRESSPGAWQKNVMVEGPKNLMAFSAIYTCVSLIADDVSKLRPKLMQIVRPGFTVEAQNFSPLGAVLVKPNRYQTRIQFLSQWMVTKLLWGNTYVYLERDDRRVVTAQYILDSRLVKPLVADDGSVWYELRKDALTGIEEAVRVPASEIIHDRMITPWHPLVGLTPIYAAATAATQGIRIQANSESFFGNMSRPSGTLTSDKEISDALASRMQEQFQKNFSGANSGKIMVAGSGLKYEPITIPPADAQLIEQLKWTVEDVARCFKVPLYKLGIGQPTTQNIGALNQEYYAQTLQLHIESLEVLQDEALGLNRAGYEVELDLDGLLRMDPLARAERHKTAISGGWIAPNEVRASENLLPLKGGDSAYLQQQNFSLEALAKRDAQDDPFKTGSTSGGGNTGGTGGTGPTGDTGDTTAEPPDDTTGKVADDVLDRLASAFVQRCLTEITDQT